MSQHNRAKKAGGSWSGLSQPSTSKGEKRYLSDDEKEQWWEWFCSQSTKKDKSSQSEGSSSQQKEDEPDSCLDTNMNYVNTNRINNFFYMYNIQNTEENIKKLEHVIEKRDFTIYKQILYMFDNCRIVEEDSSGIAVEIDLFEHRKLLEDLTNNFFHKKLGNRKFEKKIGHGYFVGNVFLTIKIYNGF